VASGVYLLGKSTPATVYAVDTSDGLVLIDSSIEANAATVTAQLQQLGLDITRLRAILLTHVHADHSLGAEGLRARTGARIYAGRGDCRPLRDGGPPEAFFCIFDMPEVTLHPTSVDVELVGGESLTFGEARFEVIATPGHTPGSVCYLLERPGLKCLFTGDLVLKLTRGSEGNLGTYTTYLPPVYRGSAQDYLASLRRLRQLPVPDLILPGHPRRDVVPQSPHLSAERWHAVLDQGIAEMERLLARYQADGANFLDGHPRELLPGLHYLGNCGGRAVYAFHTPKGLFLSDAPGGDGLIEFLGRRFKELGWEGQKPAAVLLTSADPEATAGLAALVRRHGCRVVAPRGGLETVRPLCPAGTILSAAENFGMADGFDVQTIPLGGRGRAPVAYQVRWAGKTVLLSGRIPTKLSLVESERLLSEVAPLSGSSEHYLKALDRLTAVHPALWLPAVPVYGQNANLYDDDWEKVLAQNRQLFP
jgi:glyoxylase-like metal-dependent hydrolase (beta-lactamase superfamily II)